jgi:hypothetical protein
MPISRNDSLMFLNKIDAFCSFQLNADGLYLANLNRNHLFMYLNASILEIKDIIRIQTKTLCRVPIISDFIKIENLKTLKPESEMALANDLIDIYHAPLNIENIFENFNNSSNDNQLLFFENYINNEKSKKIIWSMSNEMKNFDKRSFYTFLFSLPGSILLKASNNIINTKQIALFNKRISSKLLNSNANLIKDVKIGHPFKSLRPKPFTQSYVKLDHLYLKSNLLNVKVFKHWPAIKITRQIDNKDKRFEISARYYRNVIFLINLSPKKISLEDVSFTLLTSKFLNYQLYILILIIDD